MYKGIIFDLDGAILDTERIHKMAYQKVLKENGTPIEDTSYEKCFRSRGRVQGLRAAVPGISDEEIERLGGIKDQLFLKLVKEEQGLIYKDAMKLIEHAKKINLPIAIGTAGHKGDLLLEAVGLDKYFDAVITGRDVTRNKPDPEIYLKCSEALKIDPKDLVVIEDSEAGVQAGLAAGMDVCWVHREVLEISDDTLVLNDRLYITDDLESVRDRIIG